MKIKLIDVETNTHETQVGSCELCFEIAEVDEPVYVVEIDGETYRVAGYEWDWGHYSDIVIHNIVEFADYLSSHEFIPLDGQSPEEMFYGVLVDYHYYRSANDYEVKGSENK